MFVPTITGWVQTSRRAEQSQRKLGLAYRHGLGRAAIGCLSRNSTLISLVRSVRKSIQRTRARFHTGSVINRLHRSSFLRIAYYLTWVLSAQLTIGSLRGERITLPTGVPSNPTSHRRLRPTFFISRLSGWGYRPRGIFCLFCFFLDLTKPDPFCYNISTKKARLRRTLHSSRFSSASQRVIFYKARLGPEGIPSPSPPQGLF